MKRVLSIVAALACAVAAVAADWDQWRGPQQTGVAPENAVVTKWSQSGENVLWHVPIGGRTTPIVSKGRVFVIGPVGEGATLSERVSCVDIESGKPLWEHRFPVFHTDIVENRVGWTALAVDAETGNVYAHGTGGELYCWNRDGGLVWKHSLVEEFGRFSGYGGRLYTPIIDEGRVIISFLSQSWGTDQAQMHQRFVAFDKKSGAVVWSVAPGERPMDTTYATPVIAVIGGKRQLICPAADGWIYGLQARTGQTIWKYRLAERPVNVSPVVDGDLVYVGHSEENYDTTVMGRYACIDATGTGDVTKTHERWRHDGIDAGYATPIIRAGRVYIVDNSAQLICLDAKDGKEIWQFSLGRIGRGSPVSTADGVIYVAEQNGVFWILRDAGDKCEVLHREQFANANNTIHEIQGSPSIAGGRVYLQTRYQLFCLGSKDAKVTATPPVPMHSESDKEADGAKHTVLIVPGEATLAPGEKLTLRAVQFDSNGRELAADKVKDAPQWTLEGKFAGKLDDKTATLTASPDATFSTGVVKLKWGDCEAAARVRISPKKLPIVEDFEKYAVDANPPGWINVLGKTKIVERDGSKVLKHLAEKPSPAFMRIRTFMTEPLAGGYTISADMLGTKLPRWMPDMGVVNSRYEFILLGNEQTLRLVTWAPIPRLQKDLPFEWKPDVWYTLKLQVKLEGEKAMVRGKVWERGQPEPDKWLIEAEDPAPNKEGSPALYGYAAGTTEKKKGAEIFYDNVKITAE